MEEYQDELNQLPEHRDKIRSNRRKLRIAAEAHLVAEEGKESKKKKQSKEVIVQECRREKCDSIEDLAG